MECKEINMEPGDEITTIIGIGRVNEGIEVENKIVGNTLYLKNGTFVSFPGGAWLVKEIFDNLTIDNKIEHALKKLLDCFLTNGWPRITTVIGGEYGAAWVSGTVDDETRDAIQYAEKVLVGKQ
jgi:hypothetical protein